MKLVGVLIDNRPRRQREDNKATASQFGSPYHVSSCWCLGPNSRTAAGKLTMNFVQMQPFLPSSSRSLEIIVI